MEKWIFRIAGIYGLLSLTPLYFLESQFPLQDPPALTHPEFFYGFIGVGLAWQLVFLIISTDPWRYRPIMLAAFVEKISFAGAMVLLYAGGRVSGAAFAISQIDWILLALFVVAFRRTRTRAA